MPSERDSTDVARDAASRDRVERLIETHFPQLHSGGKLILIEEVGASTARLRLLAGERQLRPGGTVSGPSMFLLADVAVYAAILGARGEAALEAVTTNLNITFLARPPAADLVARAHLIKLGRRLAVGEVEIFSTARSEMVAHAMATYALPPA